MTKQDNFLDNFIGQQITSANAVKDKDHKPSGKLSAGKLNDPLLFQILYVLGVQGKPIDEYTLRKFKRGNDVEEWFLKGLDCVFPLIKQKFVEYRNVVGYVDALIDTRNWDFPCGVIPLEVKSVSNLKFKRIVKQSADKGHKMQAGLYALALGAEQYAISYVSTDDYRIHTTIHDTAEIKAEIDDAITAFDEALVLAKQGVYPKFEAKEKWQANLEYCRYPEFLTLTPEEIKTKLQK